MNIVVKLIILVIAIYVGAYIIPGIQIDSAPTLFVVAIVLGVLNAFVKPILVLLTLPLTIVTLGIFLLILNGAIVLLVGSLVPGFHVYSFLSAILFSIVVSLVSSLLSRFA
jgi:putative membrane protein